MMVTCIVCYRIHVIIRVYVFSVVLFYMFQPYVITSINTSLLNIVSLVKCERREIGCAKLWEVGDWGGGGGGQNLWEVGDWGLNMWEVGDWDPVSPPPPL